MAKTIADPIHPGEILLEEFLKSYNPPVSQTDAADRLGWTFVRLNQFVNGKRAVTAANAIALGELTGTSPEFWMNLQVRHARLAAQRRYTTAGARRTALDTRLLERSRRNAVDLHRLRRQVALPVLVPPVVRMFSFFSMAARTAPSTSGVIVPVRTSSSARWALGTSDLSGVKQRQTLFYGHEIGETPAERSPIP